MTLLHLFLIHRYKAAAVHYLTPDRGQPPPGREHEARCGIFESTNEEVGEIIVAEVNSEVVAALVKEADEREKLITKTA